MIKVVPELDSLRIKLGFSRNPDSRLCSFQTLSPTAVLVKTWTCDSSREKPVMKNLSTITKILGPEVFIVTSIDDTVREIDDILRDTTNHVDSENCEDVRDIVDNTIREYFGAQNESNITNAVDEISSFLTNQYKYATQKKEWKSVSLSTNTLELLDKIASERFGSNSDCSPEFAISIIAREALERGRFDNKMEVEKLKLIHQKLLKELENPNRDANIDIRSMMELIKTLKSTKSNNEM